MRKRTHRVFDFLKPLQCESTLVYRSLDNVLTMLTYHYQNKLKSPCILFILMCLK
jgi:hypothetical protein